MGLISDGLPAAIGITVFAMLALLFAMTGSLVVPLKAIIANLVSLGATFGVLTAVFRFGFGADLLDTLTVGSLNPFVVVIIFAFAFGLSMDYEVFLLGRIKEYVDAGVPTDTAVRRGLQHTGRVITSAALLMVIVFGCFAAARIGNIEQIGLGLTVAVLIDATVVRCLLVPATMTLLGRWNWWAPAWLAACTLGSRSPMPQPRTPHPPRPPSRRLHREVDVLPITRRILVRPAEHHGPLKRPASLANGVRVDESGQPDPPPLRLQIGPVEAVDHVEGHGRLGRRRHRRIGAPAPRHERFLGRQVRQFLDHVPGAGSVGSRVGTSPSSQASA